MKIDEAGKWRPVRLSGHAHLQLPFRGVTDYGADGHLAGIEILDAVKRFGDKNVFKQVILEEVALAHS